MQVPIDTQISIEQLTREPYPFYRDMRINTPVLKVKSVARILLTKALDTRNVKLNPELFSSDDPNTPMERAFQAKILMRRDAEDHMRLRSAMMPAFSIPHIKKIWVRFPQMSLADPGAVVWSGFGFRGPLNLPIVLK